MKKLFSKIMLLALTVAAFTACEDVPEPYTIPNADDISGGSEEIEGATGTGTLADPFNAVAALNYGKQLASGETSPNYMYIKGRVVSIREEFTTQYGNGTFYISSDGTAQNQFYAYRVLYLGNKRFASGDAQINVGDEVIVCGLITNYNGTIETAQGNGFLYSLNGENRGGEPDENSTSGNATGDGTLSNPFNSAAAIAYAKQVGNAESDKEVYIKGKVAAITEQYGTQFGNATFTISDDGTSTDAFTIYRALYLGNKKYAAGDLLNQGDEVIVCGKVTCYMGNTPETVQGKAYLYSLNGKTEGSGDTPTPDPQPSGDKGNGTLNGNVLTLVTADLGVENGQEPGTVKLVDGTTISFDGGGNTNTPKYYNSGTSIRMYPKNSMTVTASGKTIQSITLACSTQSGVLCNASGEVSASAGSVATSGDDVIVSGINSSSATVTNNNDGTGAASQLRFTTVTITYKD